AYQRVMAVRLVHLQEALPALEYVELFTALNYERLTYQRACDSAAGKAVADNQRVNKHKLLSNSIEAWLAVLPLMGVDYEQVAVVVYHLPYNLLAILIRNGFGVEL
ncbi:hypothetical protein, partial [Pseudomonas protegens]|uniref:hypothetical protein n=1 Tax=Pseudomonas protegens TaxID=380021 RepID=UPI001B33705D